MGLSPDNECIDAIHSVTRAQTSLDGSLMLLGRNLNSILDQIELLAYEQAEEAGCSSTADTEAFADQLTKQHLDEWLMTHAPGISIATCHVALWAHQLIGERLNALRAAHPKATTLSHLFALRLAQAEGEQ